MAITDVLRLHGRYRGGKTALVHGAEAFDYRALDRTLNALCFKFGELGIARGDLIGMALRDTGRHMIILLALARAGVVILPLDCRWHESEKKSVAAHFGAKLVMVEAGDTFTAPNRLTFDPGWFGETEKVYRDPEVTWDSPLLMSLSSGTTGLPKGPRLSHKQFENRSMTQWIDLGLNANDRYVAATPLYYGGGRGFPWTMLMAGAGTFMFPPPYEAPDLIAFVNRVNATALFLVPTLLRRVLAATFEGLAFPTLNKLISSGSMLYLEERKEIKRRLTPNLFELYSSTEGAGCSVLAPGDFDAYPDSVGRPCFKVEVEVVDQDHRPLPPGEIGRLRYRSPATPDGYFMGDSSEAFNDGWFYPGDLALMNADGYIFLKGRSKDMIIRGGVNIYPADIERVLLEVPGVVDAAVIAEASPEMGEEVVACVVTAKTMTEAALNAECRARLASYKVPRKIHFLDALPKNSFGKVLKADLAKIVAGH